MDTLSCRRRVLFAAAAAVAVVAAPVAVPLAYAVDTENVVAPVQQLTNGLLRVMKAGNATPFSQRIDMLAPIIDKTFDLDVVLRESVGPTWDNLPHNQQKMLQDAFRRYTVASYVNNFNSFKGERFQVKPDPRPVGNGEQVVQTEIIPTSGDRHELDYVMRRVSGDWRAVDVLADGSVSRVAVQRSDFRRMLTRGGPQALADSLRSKSADLSEGSS
ncbi:ABC transporter substrate-binding protein [Rhodopila sp.]|uniref:ABC transporter substrate-binding protein n=1 Tax=Rhodopila sp. TaxID=2480087 RepID=UPI003D13E1E7